MSGLQVFRAAVGPIETNCYLLLDPESGEAAAVDCALFDEAYRAMLREAGVERLKYILLTHGHFDHVCGAAALREVCGGGICISAADAPCLGSDEKSLNAAAHFVAAQTPCDADILLREGDALRLGAHEIRVWETPGHTPGSLSFFAGPNLFCGDTLFRLSMGRTDLPGGSTMQLFRSLRRFGALEEDLTVCPGHGETSTLLYEQRFNWYLHSEKYGS